MKTSNEDVALNAVLAVKYTMLMHRSVGDGSQVGDGAEPVHGECQTPTAARPPLQQGEQTPLA